MAPPPANALKILVVDSDQIFLDPFVLRFKQLREFNAAVETCASGSEMLGKIFSEAFDLIFLDTGLPDMDGLEVLARVGQTTLPLPIVTMGNSNNTRMAVEAMKRGVLDFLMKDDLLSLNLAGLLHRLLEAYRLRRENAELQQINQMKDDFLATISHELRTPLTSILGLSEVLLTGRMGPLQEDQIQSLKKILDQTHHLVHIINELLDIRALTYDRAKLQMEPLSLREVMGKQADGLRSLFEKKGVKLTLENAEDPLLVYSNSEYLNKVLDQLFSNALKFTPRSGEVRVVSKKLEAGHVQVTISDTGRGIPPAALPYVFQKFFHADQSLTRPYGGIGLGLAFCKEVVEAHGGRIWVESKGVGQGTAVNLILPGIREESPSDGSARRPLFAGKAEEGKKNILWVDDSSDLLELVEYGFAGLDRQINLVVARSGAAALSQIKAQVPDLIALDIMMPDMDGLEMMGRLRNDVRTMNVPILVVSGYRDAARKAMDRGANDYCLKPFRIQELLKKVEALLSAPAKMPSATLP